MDQGIRIIVHYEDSKQKAIDDAVYRNFLMRSHGIQPFSAALINDERHFIASDDVLEELDSYSLIELPKDYASMTYDHIDLIASDIDPLHHWAELRGAFSTMDGELLRFILHMKIPLEKFIRHELALRGHDENHKWVGFEKAKEIWRK